MNRNLLVSFLLFSNSIIGFSQVNLEWVNTFGGTEGAEFDSYDIKSDIHNQTYVVGVFSGEADFDPGPNTIIYKTNPDYEDAFIIKYNSIGEVVWAKQFKSISSTGSSLIHSIIIDDSLNIYLSGTFNLTVDFDLGPSNYNLIASGNGSAFLAKYDSLGNLIRVNKLGGVETAGRVLDFDNSGNIVFSGTFTGTVDFDFGPGVTSIVGTTGTDNGFIAKYTPGGNLIWAKGLTSSSYTSILGLTVNNSDDIIISGIFKGTTDFNTGTGTSNLSSAGSYYSSSFLGKYDSNGNYKWANRIYSSNGMVNTVGHDIGDSSEIYITGRFESIVDFDFGPSSLNLYPDGIDMFIAKYDTSANVEWAKKISGGSNTAVIPTDITVDNFSDVYVSGSFSNVAVDFDPSGFTHFVTGLASGDGYVAKYDSNCGFQWVNNYSTNEAETTRAITTDSQMNLHMCGQFNSYIDFDHGPDTVGITPKYYSNLFSVKQDYFENFIWASAPNQSNGGDDCGKTIIIDESNNIYTHGTFRGNFDFQFGTASIVPNISQIENIYAMKSDSDGNISNLTAIPQQDFSNYQQPNTELYALDKFNNQYLVSVVGETDDSVDFDLGPNTQILSSNGDADIVLIKLDSDGDMIWAKSFGGTGNDYVTAQTVDSIGNIYISGKFVSFSGENVDFDPGPGTYFLSGTPPINGYGFLAKYDSAGNFIWAHRMSFEDEPYYIEVDNKGDLILCGHTASIDLDFSSNIFLLESSPLHYLHYVAKINPDASLVWAYGFEYYTDDNLDEFIIEIDESNNIILTTWFDGIIDFDPSSSTYNLSNSRAIAKYTENFELIWAEKMGSSSSGSGIIPRDMEVDIKNNIYFTGNLVGTYDFIDGSGQYLLTSTGTEFDIFFAKYDSLGNFIWANKIDCTKENRSWDIEVSGLGEIYVTGRFAGTGEFETNGGSAIRTSNGFDDVFLAKYSQPCVSSNVSNVTSDFPTICSGSNVNISVSGNLNDALNWTWFDDVGLTNEIGTGSTITVNPSVNTTYYVKGTGFCVSGNSSVDSIVVLIDNNDLIPPVISAQSINVYLDQNGTAILNPIDLDNGSTDNCGITSYQATPSSFSCNEIGTQFVAFTVADANGNSSSTYINITILDTISPFVQSCPTDTSLFANSPSCSAVVVWDNPVVSDNCVSVIENVNFANGSSFPYGITQVNYLFNDIYGNVMSCSFSITVDTLLLVSSTTQNNLCNGDSIGQINISVLNGTSPYNFDWSNSETTEDLNSIPAGNYSVMISDANDCNFLTSFLITEPTQIQSGATTQDEIQGNDGSINLTVTGGTPPYDFDWSNSAITEDISGLASGNYNCIITDQNGCEDTITVFVGSQVGIKENFVNEIKIYPNPANDFILIELNKESSSNVIGIKINNSIGELIYQNDRYSRFIDLSGFSTGVYFISISTGDKIYTSKFTLL